MRQVGELPSVSIVVHRTTTRGLDRLVNFSDAVVAVAVTLLALPLIDLVEEGDTVSDLFRTRRVEFVTYVLVFLLMILFWIGHHRFWEKVSDYDVTLIWLNALWLLSMSLFPVFAGFDIERGPEDGQAVAYTALLGALFGAVVGLWPFQAGTRPRPARCIAFNCGPRAPSRRRCRSL